MARAKTACNICGKPLDPNRKHRNAFCEEHLKLYWRKNITKNWRRYQEEHREDMRRNSKTWYHKHREESREQQREREARIMRKDKTKSRAIKYLKKRLDYIEEYADCPRFPGSEEKAVPQEVRKYIEQLRKSVEAWECER